MDFDVIVIGTGQAGVPLAARLAAAGKRVLIAERSEIGGTCTNYGCTPTKTMIASAHAAHVARTAGRLGVQAREVSVDFAAVVARKDAVVREWREGAVARLRAAGDRLTFAKGHARFVGERQLDIGGERHRGEIVIVNVGARPAVPPIPGLETVAWLDNTRAMALPKLPEHLLVLGGGYVGCELGQMFRRLGSTVTIVEGSPHLLGRLDPDISETVEEVFRREAIELVLGSSVRGVSQAAGRVRLSLSTGRELEGSHLLVAVGRVPNTNDLGCAAAGIDLDKRGYIVVNDHYESSARGVYAVGDATPQPQFTHTSWDDHRILYDWLMGHGRRGRSGRIIPDVVFTDPQVAGVGLTEKEARAHGIPFEVATMPFGDIARAIEVDEKAGRLKVLLDPQTERILGAAFVGAEAGELLHMIVVLMQAGAPARAIVDAEMVHPTFAEGVQQVVMRLPRYALS